MPPSPISLTADFHPHNFIETSLVKVTMTFFLPNTMVFSLVPILSDLVAISDTAVLPTSWGPFPTLLSPACLLLGPPTCPWVWGLPGILSLRHLLSPGLNQQISVWLPDQPLQPPGFWILYGFPTPSMSKNQCVLFPQVTLPNMPISNMYLRQVQAQSFGAMSSTPFHSTHPDSQGGAAANPSHFWPSSTTAVL